MSRSALSVAVLVCCLGAARESRATLGDGVASVADDRARLGAVTTVEKLAAGERHRLSPPSGAVIDEYVAPGGAVYAVAWRGPRMPDLRALLGRYFVKLGVRRRNGHHRATLAGDDLVVQSSGRRGAFTGRAWVPSLVPAGVDPQTTVEYRR